MHKSNNVNDNNITNISSLISKQDKNEQKKNITGIFYAMHIHTYMRVSRVNIPTSIAKDL